MARYILIDIHSGYVFGDTADMPAGHLFQGGEFAGRSVAMVGGGALTPVLAARWLDEAVIGEFGRSYEEHGARSGAQRGGQSGYLVYRADLDGSDAVPVVQDGQDRETIEAVERDCRLEAIVIVSDAEE